MKTRYVLPALGAGLVVVLSGCSGGGTPAAAPTAQQGQVQQDGPQSNRGGANGEKRPGAFGEIAAVTGEVLQVQDTDSQTAVTIGKDTVITRTKAAKAADVVVGSCIVATTGSMIVVVQGATPSAAPTQDADKSSEAASTVAISAAADDGTCAAGGFGGGPGGAGNPGGGTLPDGATPPADGAQQGQAPDGATPPTGAPGQGEAGGPVGNFMRPTAGKVTAVTDTTITVEASGQDSPATVTIDKDTAYTTTVAASSTDVEVGLCAAAMGKSDDRGGLTATTLTLSEAGENGCSSGFVMNRRGGGPDGAPGTDQGAEGTVNESGSGNA